MANPVAAAAAGGDTFQGYPRANGRAGTRNHLGVIVVGNCAATAARRVAEWFTPKRLSEFPNVDGVLPFVHELGCGMEKTGEPMDLLRRTLGGTIRNPNLAGAVVMALGCERNNIYAFLEQEGLEAGAMLKTVVLQEVGGTAHAVEQGIAAIKEMLPAANAVQRQAVPVRQLVVALQTADVRADDAHARAALGAAVDRLVQQGGTVIVSATTANAPALAPRTASAEVGQALEQRIHWWGSYTAGRDVQRPAPAAADALHAGTAPVRAVFGYAHALPASGLVLMDAPAYEAISATGQVAAGANLVCLLTSAGSGFGAAGAPTVRIAADSALYARMADDLDLDCGSGSTGALPAAEAGARIYERWLQHASGRATSAEEIGLGDNEFVPWPVGVLA